MNNDWDMRRKVQQLGSSTKAVSLPSEWICEHGIEKGDILRGQRDEHTGSLLLLPADHTDREIVTVVDADTITAEMLEYIIIANYTMGRRTIRITASEELPSAFVSSVGDLEQQLMGLGIVEQLPTRLEIRCSVAPDDFELISLLERLWRTEALIRDNAIESFLEAESETNGLTDNYKQQADKLFYLFLRLLFTTYRNPRLNSSMGLKTGFPLIGYRSVAQDLVLMTDCAVRINDFAVDCRQSTDTMIEVIEEVAVSLDEAVSDAQAVVTNPCIETSKTAHQSLAVATDTLDAAQAHLEAERPEPLLELQQLLSTLREIAVYASDTIEVGTNLAARDVSQIKTES